MRLKFIFRIFDNDCSEEIDRLEFRNVITSFIEMILQCKFDSEGIQEKIKTLQIESQNPSLIEKVLDLYVDEIYSISYTQEYLTYEEWEKWIKSIDGIENILNFNGMLKFN